MEVFMHNVVKTTTSEELLDVQGRCVPVRTVTFSSHDETLTIKVFGEDLSNVDPDDPFLPLRGQCPAQYVRMEEFQAVCDELATLRAQLEELQPCNPLTKQL